MTDAGGHRRRWPSEVGAVDVLFNGAGFVHAGTRARLRPRRDWDFAFDLNVRSMYRTDPAPCCPACWRKGGGSIINVASVAGSIKGAPNRFVYGTTKAAVIGLTKSVAADFITRGVRCNAICPGTVESPSLRERIAAQAKASGQTLAQVEAAFVARQPMGRLGTRRAKSPRWRCTLPATNRPSPPAPPRSSTAAGPTDSHRSLCNHRGHDP